eukprot:1160745-Pelagomonas_calceolata.AAC.18
MYRGRRGSGFRLRVPVWYCRMVRFIGEDTQGINGLKDIQDPSNNHTFLPQNRDIHSVGFKFCPATNPFPTLDAATPQHANTITRLKTHSLRNPNRNNEVTLHIILVGVADTFDNGCTACASLSGDFWGRVFWACGGGAQEKESPGRPGAWRATLQILFALPRQVQHIHSLCLFWAADSHEGNMVNTRTNEPSIITGWQAHAEKHSALLFTCTPLES